MSKYLLITGLILIILSIYLSSPETFIEEEHPVNQQLINKSSPYYGYRPPVIKLLTDNKGNKCEPVNNECVFKTKLLIGDELTIRVLAVDYDSDEVEYNFGEGWTSSNEWTHKVTISDYNINQSFKIRLRDKNNFYYAGSDYDNEYLIKYRISLP